MQLWKRLGIGLLAFLGMNFLYAMHAQLALPACKQKGANYAGCNLVLVSGSGVSQSITVQNNSTIVARNIAATLPASWTDVTQNASGCVSLAPGATCKLIFTPGSTLHPIQTIPVKGSNTTTVTYTMSVVSGNYTVGGTVSGLSGITLILKNNGSDDLVINSNGSFTFPTTLTQGSSYTVTLMQEMPSPQTCTLTGGTGVIGTSNVTNVQVTCSTNTYSVGGSISGLTGSITLQNNGTDSIVLNANSPFTFPTQLADGSPYAVTVLTQPLNQFCSVVDGTGIINSSNVTNVAVSCLPEYTIQSSAGPNGTISPTPEATVVSGGTITFTATPDLGSGVDEWLLDSVPVQTGGSTYQLSNVTANHTVEVTFNVATFTSSVSSLALSVNNTGLNPALTGNARQITITNSGVGTAMNLAVTTPTGLPPGTTISGNTCTGNLISGGTCVITITPGSASSLDASSAPCTSGTVPEASMVTVTADSALPLSISTYVLGYGCQYQSGLVFTVDDTTPVAGSIGGRVVSVINQAAVPWDANPACAYPTEDCLATGATSVAYGQNLSTVPGSLNPSGTGTNGPGNTWLISSILNGTPGNTNVAPATYAAGVCISYNAGGYNNWYLPSECGMAEVFSPGCSTQTIINSLPFIVTGCSGTVCMSGDYWTSSDSPALSFRATAYSVADDDKFSTSKWAVHNVRCIHDF